MDKHGTFVKKPGYILLMRQKLKQIQFTLFILLFVVSGTFADFQSTLTPHTTSLAFEGTLTSDTAMFNITNVSGENVDNFFVTAHTDYEISYLEVFIDGTQQTIQTESEFGTVYSNKITSHWIIPQFSSEAVFIFHTLNATNQEYTFCGSKSFPFFADVYSTATPCCNNIRGNINGDASDLIDIGDLVYFVDYSFGTPAGPAPVCFDEADVNADGGLDISDIVYLVNFMFSSGPQPQPCQ